MGRAYQALISALGLLLLVELLLFAHSPVYNTQIAFDVSWPNCQTSLTYNSQYGLVGVNAGLAFTTNPCMHQEASHFERYSLYLNTGYPGVSVAARHLIQPVTCQLSDNPCIAYDYGYQAAVFAIRTAALQGLHTNQWWLDVENANSWSDDTSLNRASLEGMVQAIKDTTLFSNIGYYSYPGQWDLLTGSWDAKLPAWIATGTTAANTAQQACDTVAFDKGEVVLGQYTEELDQNKLCSAQYFHHLSNT